MSAHAWMASAFAATWHKVAVSARGTAPAAACGHRIGGPVHRRLIGPLPDDGRIPCAACAAVLATFRGTRELRAPYSGGGYFSGQLPTGPGQPEWPDADPEDPRNPPGRNGIPDNSAEPGRHTGEAA